MFIDIWCEKKLQIEAKFTHVNEHFYAKNIHYVYESRCQKIQKKVFNINAFFGTKTMLN